MNSYPDNLPDLIEYLRAVREEGRNASVEQRMRLAARLVNLVHDPSSKIVESDDRLAHIVEDLASDLEWGNGPVDDLWAEIAIRSTCSSS